MVEVKEFGGETVKPKRKRRSTFAKEIRDLRKLKLKDWLSIVLVMLVFGGLMGIIFLIMFAAQAHASQIGDSLGGMMLFLTDPKVVVGGIIGFVFGSKIWRSWYW